MKNTIDKDSKAAISNYVTRIDKCFDNGDGFYAWRDLRYLLFEYEYKLASKNNIEKLDWNMFSKSEKDKLTIEHILPQTPSKWYWRNQYRMYSEKEITTLSSSMGNLLPLAQSINSSLQNDSFIDKKTSNSVGRRGYENGSHSEIEVSKETDWTSFHIYQRGLKILTFMEERWNFQFVSEQQKRDLLHIDFIFKDRVDVPELPEYTEIKPAFEDDLDINNTDTQQSNLAFWTGFVEYCKAIGRDSDIAKRKPYAVSWYDISIGVSSYHMFFSIIGSDILRVGVYIEDINTFQRLESKKQAIEEMCGLSLDWYSSRESSTQKRILYSVTTDIYNAENQRFCFGWLVEHFDRIKSAFLSNDNFVLESSNIKDNAAKKLTIEMAEIAYDIAKRVYSGSLGRTEGRNEIVRLTGMNSGSAGDYITDYLAMMDGMQYARTLNEYSTRYFLEHIMNDFGSEYLQKAISACRKHAEYYASLGHVNLHM